MPTKIRPDPHLSFITDGLSGRFICTPGGIRFRSLNRRTDTLEWCLCSFRANELSSFVFGTPHWGGICIVRPRPTAVCPNPQNIANRKTLPKGEGCSVGTPGGIRTHGLPLRSWGDQLFSKFREVLQSAQKAYFLTDAADALFREVLRKFVKIRENHPKIR